MKKYKWVKLKESPPDWVKYYKWNYNGKVITEIYNDNGKRKI